MVADTEIAARRRGGIEWRTPDAVAVSVLARPEMLDPSAVDVGWAAAGLAAARALDACRDGRRSCLWPDLIACEPDDDLEVAVNSVCTLGPGRVELAALTVRVGPLAESEERTLVTDRLTASGRISGELWVTYAQNQPENLTDRRVSYG